MTVQKTTENRLAPADLRWHCPPEELSFESTEELEPLRGVIGQDDAMDALSFGLEIFAPGQNVFVRGLTGTGRLTLVRRILKEIQPACPLAPDYVYVANFESSERPKLLILPRGRARELRDAIDRLLQFVRTDLAPALESEAMRGRRQAMDEGLEKRLQEIGRPFEDELKANQLSMSVVQVGTEVRPMLMPVIGNEPTPPEKIQQLHANGDLSDEDIQEIQDRIQRFAKKLATVSQDMQKLRLQHAENVRDFYRGEAAGLLEGATRRIREQFPIDAVHRHLDELIADLLRGGIDEVQKSEGALSRYKVNVVLGHHPTEGCPIIVENTPTMSNLLGSIDRRFLPEGGAVSDHTMILGGSLLRADGGYLILEAMDVLNEPGAWRVLVRTLRTGRLEIVPPEVSGPWGSRMMKPESIPINLKVVLIGDADLYHALDSRDADFPQLFKVLADFDSTIERSPSNIVAYASFLARVSKDEKLPHFDRSAVAALAEHGARIAGRNDRLTTRFGRLTDLAREAAFLAQKSGEKYVSGARVKEAVRRTKRRADLPARKFRERVEDGTIQIQTQGKVVGQVNGLAVISSGPLRYGFPARITATMGAGHAGAINIERESQLSGAIHTKGFYILGGLLRHLLRTQHPLAFSASIAFEQSYGGIDGDSASGAEMCCLLSALTEIPLRQDMAMTGAIDQHGHILPIGAASEKIEGFFDTCQALGMTGSQGVIIPRANVRDLMLREDVVAACAEERFHVHAVDTIQEALELFTDVPAGERDEEGEYPEGSLLHTAVERAFEYWTLATSSPQQWEKVEEDEEEVEA